MSPIDSQSSRQSFWENHVHAWHDSGLSKARYCRDRELSYHQFIYWVPKIGLADRTSILTTQAPKFLPVTIKHQAVPHELQIKLSNGAIISGITLDSVEIVGALMAQL